VGRNEANPDLQHELSQWCWMVFGLHRSLTSEERFDEARYLLRITTESMALPAAYKELARIGEKHRAIGIECMRRLAELHDGRGDTEHAAANRSAGGRPRRLTAARARPPRFIATYSLRRIVGAS
jgi:hypothetical protein